MKVSTLSYSDVIGGAARAAYRIHRALRGHGIDSVMQVNHASTGDWTVQALTSRWDKLHSKICPTAVNALRSLVHTCNTTTHSPGLIPSRWPTKLNKADVDLLHLHWVNHEMLSVEDIGCLRKPIVWTLHDMWAFCGMEHYTEDLRWRDGYLKTNRPAGEAGLDLNRWVWYRKHKAWRSPIHIVSPSHWLAECARQSELMRDWPITVIHNAIDTNVWQPVNKQAARHILNLPHDRQFLLFGAMGGALDPRKGFDLLKLTLQFLRGRIVDLELLVFGQMEPRESVDLGFPIHFVGHLNDDLSLKLLYSAADAMIIPSRQDNLPNTGVEALACGIPVVAFDTCGLPDIVKHKKTGYLAHPFDPEDMANGIAWVLSDRARHEQLSINARHDAESRFSYQTIGEQYANLYEKVLISSRPNGVIDQK